jgi:hypothetical protein
VLQGCANIWDVDRAYQTFEAISSTFGLTPDIHSVDALLNAFGKAKKMDDGHTPMWETLFKVWRRSQREGDVKTSDTLCPLMKSLGYRDCYLGRG